MHDGNIIQNGNIIQIKLNRITNSMPTLTINHIAMCRNSGKFCFSIIQFTTAVLNCNLRRF